MAIGGMMVLLLAGCQAVTDDPRHGGFLSGISNLATGGYEARIQREKANLQVEQGTRARLGQRAAELEREREQLVRELAVAETRTADIERTIRRHKARLAASQSGRSPEMLQLVAMEGQVHATRTRIDRAEDPDRPVDEARGDITQIMATLDDLSTAAARLAAQ
jgi:predicted  nucleic acid-binding Zn-ribbon protein